jgi:hypothetical protein
MALAVWNRTIVDEDGTYIPLASIEVRIADGLSLATIYSDSAGTTPIANPLTASATGFAQFYALSNTYSIEVNNGTSTITWLEDLIAEAETATLAQPFTETDAAMASVTIPEGIDVLTRMPSTASAGQVAPIDQYTFWRKIAGTTSTDPYFVTAGPVTWVRTGVREDEILSTFTSGISGVFNNAEIAGLKPFVNRAAFLAASISSVVDRVSWYEGDELIKVIRDTAQIDGPIAQTDGTLWYPDGVATPCHYGMALGNTTVIRVANNAALLACVTNHDLTLIPQGYWRFEEDLDLVGLDSRTIFGEGRPTLAFQTNSVVNGIYWGPADLSLTTYAKGLTLRSLNIVGPGNNHTAGSGLHLNNANACNVDNVTVQQFYSCYRVSGGQNNNFTNIQGFGRPNTVVSNTDGSSIFWNDMFTTTGGTIVPAYTCSIDGFTFGGNDDGVQPNTHDIFRIEAGDNFSASTGSYISSAARSLVYVRTTGVTNIAQITLNDVYLDGRRFGGAFGQTPHCVYVDAALSTGKINRLAFTGECGIANAASDAIVVVSGSRLKRLLLTGANITSSGGKSADIVGSTGADGLHIMGESLNIYGTGAGGFYVNDAASVSINGTFETLTDATASLSLSGTVEHVRHAINLVNCAGGIVDTSTGLVAEPAYEFIKTGTTTPTITFGGNNAGITYSASTYCYYTVVANRVLFNALVLLTSKGTSNGDIKVKLNMPSEYYASEWSAVSLSFNTLARGTSANSLQGEVLQNTSQVRLSHLRDNGTNDVRVPLDEADFSNTSTIYVSGQYRYA